MRGEGLYTSESVAMGHPDKIADQIADALLDAYLTLDPASRVAVEVTVTSGYVLVAGEVTSRGAVAISEVVRQVIREIGYTDPELGFAADTVAVEVRLHAQSPDIALGVDQDQGRGKALGAGDQGMMYGYACGDTPELMPLPLMLAHGLMRRLGEVRQSGALPFLRPDGKSQVSVEYRDGVPQRVAAIVVSAQHNPEVELEELRAAIREEVMAPIIPATLWDADTRVYINPTGRFVIGGPHGDTGATGRKLMVDTYGSLARHGGGSFSGKDPTKVDRSATYALRQAAKAVVATGLAGVCELRIAYAIGEPKPLALGVETWGTARVAETEILRRVQENFDFSPAGIIAALDLLRPIYRPAAVFGHFGRSPENGQFPWEEERVI